MSNEIYEVIMRYLKKYLSKSKMEELDKIIKEVA